MQNLKDVVQQLETIDKNLQTVQAEINKAEGRYDAAMEVLKNAGFSSIEEAEAAYIEKEKGIIARTTKLQSDVDTFLTEYNRVFKNE